MRNFFVITITLLITVFTMSACAVPTLGKKVSADSTPIMSDGATPDVTETTSPNNVPTSTSTHPTPPQVTPSAVVSLLGDSPPASTMPTPNATAASVLHQARYSTPRFSFEPATGWQVDEINPDTVLIHPAGDSSVYDGFTNRSPYIYIRYTDVVSSNTRLIDVLDDMRATILGAQTVEDAATPIIDGLRGVGQFVEGYNNTTGYRAYLVAFPLQDGVLKCVFWGEKDRWHKVAPQLNVVLATLRFPRL